MRVEPFAALFWALDIELTHIQYTDPTCRPGIPHPQDNTTVDIQVQFKREEASAPYLFPSSCIIYLWSTCSSRSPGRLWWQRAHCWSSGPGSSQQSASLNGHTVSKKILGNLSNVNESLLIIQYDYKVNLLSIYDCHLINEHLWKIKLFPDFFYPCSNQSIIIVYSKINVISFLVKSFQVKMKNKF